MELKFSADDAYGHEIIDLDEFFPFGSACVTSETENGSNLGTQDFTIEEIAAAERNIGLR